jgi:hypothetical protein
VSGVITDAVAAEVIERAGGFCEADGGRLDADGGVFHHRKRRGYGDHSAANLMYVHARCHNGHTNAIHFRVDRSRRLRHILYDYQIPAAEPVVVLRNLLEMTE